MKALILNSGVGHRMGDVAKGHPKCMTEIDGAETIVSRQLVMLSDFGVSDVVITTGCYDSVLTDYCASLELPLNIRFVKNELYEKTNYIYSIYLVREFLDDDIVLIHGDLVFESHVLEAVLQSADSCMAVSSTTPLSQKDFKAVIHNGKIEKVGIEFFDDAVNAQPLYKLNKKDWLAWLKNICFFCEQGKCDCYAENALNEVLADINLMPLDVRSMLCAEIDTPTDLKIVSENLQKIKRARVYSYSDARRTEKNIRRSGLFLNLQNEDEKSALSIGHLPMTLALYGVTKYLFVCGKHLRKTPVYAMLKAIDFPRYEYADFTPNPKYEEVASGVQKYTAEHCDGIFAVGGGSTIDVAKCIKWECAKQGKRVPLFALPTTAGTGSEATQFAVIYKDGIKKSVDDPLLLPDEIFKETALLSSVPTYHRASAAFDALCHAIESWWSPKSTKESVSYSALAIKTLCHCMDGYIDGDTSPTVFEKMFFAAHCAGKAINITRTTAPHAMSYGLTSMYEVAHGHAVALCLPKVWRFMLSCCDAKLSETFSAIALAMGCRCPEDAVALFERWTARTGFSAPKASDGDIETLVKDVNHERLQNNPVQLSVDSVKRIYYDILPCSKP